MIASRKSRAVSASTCQRSSCANRATNCSRVSVTGRDAPAAYSCQPMQLPTSTAQAAASACVLTVGQSDASSSWTPSDPGRRGHVDPSNHTSRRERLVESPANIRIRDAYGRWALPVRFSVDSR
jgi:hypothetical protein